MVHLELEKESSLSYQPDRAFDPMERSGIINGDVLTCHNVRQNIYLRVLTETSSNCFNKDSINARLCGRVFLNSEYKKPLRAVGKSSCSFFL